MHTQQAEITSHRHCWSCRRHPRSHRRTSAPNTFWYSCGKSRNRNGKTSCRTWHTGRASHPSGCARAQLDDVWTWMLYRKLGIWSDVGRPLSRGTSRAVVKPWGVEQNCVPQLAHLDTHKRHSYLQNSNSFVPWPNTWLHTHTHTHTYTHTHTHTHTHYISIIKTVTALIFHIHTWTHTQATWSLSWQPWSSTCTPSHTHTHTLHFYLMNIWKDSNYIYTWWTITMLSNHITIFYACTTH